MTVNYANILAFGAVGAEAKEDPDIADYLSDDEAKRGRTTRLPEPERSLCPDWLDTLIASHPRILVPGIRDAFATELSVACTRDIEFSPYRLVWTRLARPLRPAFQKIAFDWIRVAKEPIEPSLYDCMVGMVWKIDLTPAQRKRLCRLVETRFAAHQAAQRETEML